MKGVLFAVLAAFCALFFSACDPAASRPTRNNDHGGSRSWTDGDGWTKTPPGMGSGARQRDY